jgi:hypothetical protein
MENLNDRKVLKSTKINETLRKLLNETGVHVGKLIFLIFLI